MYMNCPLPAKTAASHRNWSFPHSVETAASNEWQLYSQAQDKMQQGQKHKTCIKIKQTTSSIYDVYGVE